MCKVYTGYHGTSQIEHGLCACTVDNPLAKARGLSLRTGAHTMLYLSLIFSGCVSELTNDQYASMQRRMELKMMILFTVCAMPDSTA